MGKFNIDNDHYFEFDSDELGPLVLDQDPLNWDSDDKEFTYDKVWGGTLAKVNTSLEFAGEGYTYLRRLFGFGFGIQPTITKHIKNAYKLGEDWRMGFRSAININKTEFDKSRTTPVAKVEFTVGGLYDKIKARYSDKFDLVSTKDVNGNDITELDTITENVLGREIFRRSVASVEDGVLINHVVSGGDKDNAKAIPFLVKPNSDQENIDNVTKGLETLPFNDGDYAAGTVGSLLFLASEGRHERKINGKIKIRITNSDAGVIKFEHVFYKYNTATSTYDYINKKETLTSVSTSSIGTVLEHDYVDYPLTLEDGEAMAIGVYSRTDDGIQYEYLDTQIEITEDESYEPTKAKGLLPFEMFDRFLEKITGEKGLLISNVFGRKDLGYAEDGEWSTLGAASGFWARGFDLGEPITNPDTGEIEPLKQLNLSLKDAYESFYMAVPLTASVVKIGAKEYFRIEKYEYTQQDFVGIRMGRILKGEFQHIPASKAVETVLEDNLFNSAQIGFQKGGNEYEEVAGLKSPHGQSRFSIPSKSDEPNEYSKLSVIRGDLEGYDLARRKQSVDFPDTDTTYDQDIFFRHWKKAGTQYVLRVWQDDFAEAPQGEGVYSPNTMGNLLLTPIRCLLRHGRILVTSVIGRPNESVVFLSSNCFSSFSTTLIGSSAIQEDGSIKNTELGAPFTNGFLLSFTGKVFQSMVDEMEGYTIIDGEKVPNWYGRFEVEVDGVLQYGRLVKSNITGEGKHEIALI